MGGPPELTPARRVAITGCGVVSPIGLGRQPFTEALLGGRSGLRPVVGDYEPPLPCLLAGQVADFDGGQWLGKKGTRFLDRSTMLAIAAAALALEDGGLGVDEQTTRRVGVVLGTAMGSLKSISDFGRETLLYDRPFLVNPMLFPNTVLNSAAGQVAIWLKLRGINTTVANGQLSSLMAISYAGRAIGLGYADAVLAGGMEELCEQIAWAAHHAGYRELLESTRGEDVYPGEGASILLVEEWDAAAARGHAALAELLGCASGFYCSTRGDGVAVQARGLAACLSRLIRSCGVAPDEVAVLSTGSSPDDHESVESLAIETVFGERHAARLDVKSLIGECYSAAGAFQCAALLAHFASSAASRRPYGIVTSAGKDGAVACALFKRGD
jgi:3-oxoacyl-[acyl-carrier-protein] synthase II